MSESGAPLDSFEVLLRRRMVSASDRALRPFEPSTVALKAAAGSAAWPAAKPARRTGWYVLLAAMLVVAALVFAAGSGAFRNLIVAPVGPSPSPYSSVAPSLAPVAPSLAPSQTAVTASPGVSASSADAEGLILFGVSVSVKSGATGTYCTMFYTIHPDGSGERQLPADCLPYGNAYWGPTGDSIIYDSTPLHSTSTLISEGTADGGSPRALLTLSGGFMPAFSPDGSQIAYAGLGSAPGARGIFIADADGTKPRQLTSPKAGISDFGPLFSPDGSRLVFTRFGSNSTEVWMVNGDGTDLHSLTADLPESMSAHWSPDGSHLLFSGTQTVGTDVGLWTINGDGTGLTPIITDTHSRDENADWSPDGSRIVYTHFEPAIGVRSLRLMNADGSGVTTLSYPIGAGGNNPILGPDWGQPVTH
jgi:Tol biopolymer transport system component